MPYQRAASVVAREEFLPVVSVCSRGAGSTRPSTRTLARAH